MDGMIELVILKMAGGFNIIIIMGPIFPLCSYHQHDMLCTVVYCILRGWIKRAVTD
jgi:hypothetical protein